MKCFCENLKALYICLNSANGTLAQLVEQRTENPCVPGSIPGGTTLKPCNHLIVRVFCCGNVLFVLNIVPITEYFS